MASAYALELGKQNENFKVFIRCRPMIKRELADGCKRAIDAVEGGLA